MNLIKINFNLNEEIKDSVRQILIGVPESERVLIN